MNKDEENSALDDDLLLDEGEESKKASTEVTITNENLLFVLIQTMNDNMATMSESLKMQQTQTKGETQGPV